MWAPARTGVRAREAAAPVAIRAGLRLAAQRALDRADVGGLRDVDVEARVGGPCPVGRGAVAGERDEGGMLAAGERAEGAREGVPVHVREADVDHERVGRLL